MQYELIKEIADIIGIIGVVLVLIAYLFLNTSKMSATNIYYQLMNLSGSCFILFSLLFSWNLASVIIEIAWIFISLIGVYRCYRLYIQRQNRAREFVNKDKL